MSDGEEMLLDRAKISGHRHLIEIKIKESCMNRDKCSLQQRLLIPEDSAGLSSLGMMLGETPVSSIVLKALRGN